MTIASLVSGSTVAQMASAPVAAPAVATSVVDVAAQTHGRVFLLRGLANVFSLGMDKLGRKLRAKGVPAKVTNFSNWRQFADYLIDEYRSGKNVKPVIIMGHSLGADAAVNMGNYLAGKRVPVRLIVAFDGVAGSGPVNGGIAEVINYYKGDALGAPIKASSSFRGKLTNIDVSGRDNIGHLNIEKSNALQSEVVAKVAAIYGR